MLTHYQVLGVAQDAKPDEIVAAYRKVVADVMPKHSLYPTSVLTVDKFRVVQDAYECLINPKARAEYDTQMQELAAEEQSLFGERKARRKAKEEESKKVQKAPPPYVWNEDTNSPLFWTPGRKLIEGPKTTTEEKPVAYFKRSSLEKQLVLVSKDTNAQPKSATPPPKASPKATAKPSPSAASPILISLPTNRSSTTTSTSSPPPKYSPPPSKQVVATQPNPAGVYLLSQRLQIQAMQERQKRYVEAERAKYQHELDKRRKAVEKERKQRIQIEIEVRRRLAERERELMAKEREKKLKEAKEKSKPQKRVQWGQAEVAFEPVKEVERATHGLGWFSDPEPRRTRHRVLRKLRRFV